MAKRKSNASDPSSPALFNGQRGSAQPGDAEAGIAGVSLHEAARSRYLNYSLSVITSRALPDVRDGLKPVQRRILYTMWQQRLFADAKPRKCAKVCGDVMGNYHPHGDGAIYDALVRMAQDWVMRERMVDGHGNFGSMDGDPPAAMRYTECRLAPLATALLEDIGRETVTQRENYDNTRREPVVLPSKVPTLLVNGAAGIAVGMATNIPPHNLGEVCKALLKVLDNPEIKDYQVVGKDAIQGPDFPTGGRIVSTTAELRTMYETGSGSLKVRGTATPGAIDRSTKTLILDSVPYGTNKSALVEQIGQIVVQRKMPLIQDVRDVSTEDVRIELTLKKDADEDKVLAYLYRHTGFQTNVQMNLTCLVPTENPLVGRPERLSLLEVLRYFLIFRHSVVTRRLEHELRALRKRLHILRGFALIFDVLDEIIAIIRKSDGKADAAKKIMKRFPIDGPGGPEAGLDADQTDAILELKLYRLAHLEINLVKGELDDKAKRAKIIEKLLADNEKDTGAGRWKLVRDEVEELRKTFADARKLPRSARQTQVLVDDDEPEYSAEDFIIDEQAVVLVTADGWVKRQRQIDPATTRLREGDRALACIAGSTRSCVALFSSAGVCYTARIADIPATTGYGEPIQKLFKLTDGEHLVAACSLDPRVVGDITPNEKKPDDAPPVHALAATSDGYGLRFALTSYAEPSTRSGRKFARPAKGQHVVGVSVIDGSETILAVSEGCRAMICPAEQINLLAGPGKGVLLVKLTGEDRLLGFKASTGDRDLLTIETHRGATKNISTAKYQPTSRGGKGFEVQKNGRITRIVPEPVQAPDPPADNS